MRARRSYIRYTVISGLLATFAIGVASALLGPSLSAFATTFALSWGQVGRAFSAQFGGKLAAVVVLSVWGRSWAPGRTACVGLALLATGLGAVSMAPSWSLTLAALLLFGLGHGSTDAGFNALFVETWSDKSGQSGTAGAWLNRLHLLFGLGALSGPLVFGVLQRAGLPWRLAFALAASVGAVSLVLGAIGGVFADRRRDEVVEAGVTEYEQNPVAARPFLAGAAMVACFLCGGLETTIGGWLFTFLVGVSKFADSWAATSLTLFWALLAGGRLLSSWGVRLYGELRWMLILGGMLCVSLVVGVSCSASSAALILAAAGLGLSGLFPTLIAWATKAIVPGRPSSMVAPLIAGSSLGAVTVPWLVGVVADLGGLVLSFVLVTGLAVVLELILIAVHRRDEYGAAVDAVSERC